MENLQIVSLNVRGLQNKNKRNRIFQHFNVKKYEIILLQETHSTQQDGNEWKKEWEGPAFFSSINNLKYGVGIFVITTKRNLKQHMNTPIKQEGSLP